MKNKQIGYKSKITSERHDIFTENFAIFFSNAGEIRNVPEFIFDKF